MFGCRNISTKRPIRFGPPKTVLENCFRKLVFGKLFLENCFWKIVFGKLCLENCVGNIVFGILLLNEVATTLPQCVSLRTAKKWQLYNTPVPRNGKQSKRLSAAPRCPTWDDNHFASDVNGCGRRSLRLCKVLPTNWIFSSRCDLHNSDR